MRLQLVWLAALYSIIPNSSIAVPQSAIYVGQINFLDWLALSYKPTTTTVSPTVISTTTSTPSRSNPIERECYYCRCGLINTVRRLVGGQEMRQHQYPWMAAILIDGKFHCSGSLINDLYVLTAAHCILEVPAELITIRLLEHNRSNSDAMVKQRYVSKVKPHELYNPYSFDHDIALLRLDWPLELSGTLRPICVPITSDTFEGELATVTGWGAQPDGELGTDTLREVNVLVLSQAECRNSSYRPGQITDKMLCAGYLDAGVKDACSGDTGGPLHVLFDEQVGQYQLAGIVSWGDGCGRSNGPGVFTRVNCYQRWIRANTPGACVCVAYAEEDYRS